VTRVPLLDTPAELAERYWNELIELVAEGEISAVFAQQVRNDLFLAAAPDEKPALRSSVWRAYVEGQQALLQRESWWRRLLAWLRAVSRTPSELDSATDEPGWSRDHPWA